MHGNRCEEAPPCSCRYFDLEQRSFHVWKYWELPLPNHSSDTNIAGQDYADRAWSLLTDSVRLRLRSDVPSGIFLSGGLDSSLITAAAAQISTRAIKTFTVALPGSELDESIYAQNIADFFSTEHHVLSIDTPVY